MERKEYLAGQKQEHGRAVIGVFPALFPRELLWAAGAVPAEIWDPPLEPGLAGAHLQPYTCGIVKLGLELVLSGQADLVDGFLFPHTCDSIQNLASVIFDYCQVDKPCWFFYHPKAPYGAASRTYFRERLQALVDDLAKQFGAISPEALAEAVETGQTLNPRLRGLYQRRAAGGLGMSGVEFYELLRQGEYLHPEDFIPLLDEALARPAVEPRSGPAVVLSGVLPNPIGIVEQLDGLGVRIVHDDLLMGSRRIPARDFPEGDPLDRLTAAYFTLPPCSTRTNSIAERLEYLLKIIDEGSAGGVIFHMVKFCEPEYFDLPILAEELKKRGIPSLVLDTEPNQAHGGQMATRIDAFLEMIG